MGAKFLCRLLLCSLPLHNLRLTSPFGYRLHPIYHTIRLHAGIDLAAHNDTVFTVLDGRVTACRYDAGLGLYLHVDHAGGLQSTYGHLSQWLVLPGDTVRAGDAIAVSGATGTVTGEHLHFAVSCQGRWLDPLQFLLQLFNYSRPP